MLSIKSVHFDDYIPNWKTHSEVLDDNVLVLVMEGKVSYRINEEEYVGEKGDFIFIPRLSIRAGNNHPSSLHQKYTVLFTCGKAVMSNIPLLWKGQFVHFKIRNFPYLQQRFERLYQEFRNGGNYQSFVCLGILHELVGLLARELEKPEIMPMKTKLVQHVQQYVLEHYREQIMIEQLAGLIDRSPNYTTSIFREVIGKSPIQYVHELRMMEACSLLRNSDMTISAISTYLGYYDTSYFFRIFKKHNAMSPTDFATDSRQ